MEILSMIFSWVVKMTYFYMLHWWGVLCFLVMVFIIAFIKNCNYEEGDLVLDPWRYLLPRALLDASVWPLWIIGGISGLDLANRTNDITDSLLVGGIIFLDILAWTYLRYGQANFLIAILAGIVVAICWLPILYFHVQFRDPEEALV